jgi:hypothetical protein
VIDENVNQVVALANRMRLAHLLGRASTADVPATFPRSYPDVHVHAAVAYGLGVAAAEVCLPSPSDNAVRLRRHADAVAALAGANRSVPTLVAASPMRAPSPTVGAWGLGADVGARPSDGVPPTNSRGIGRALVAHACTLADYALGLMRLSEQRRTKRSEDFEARVTAVLERRALVRAIDTTGQEMQQRRDRLARMGFGVTAPPIEVDALP